MSRSCAAAVWVVLSACASAPRAQAEAQAEPEGWNGYATAERCAPDGQHVRLHMVQAELALWMNAEEEARLEAIDLSGTRGGARALELAAADAVVRALGPLELEALGLADAAARLRALAPITDEATRQAALSTVEALSAADVRRAQTSPDAIDRALDRSIPAAEVYESPMSLSAMLAGLEMLAGEDPDPSADDAMHCYELGELRSVESDVAQAAIEAGAPRDEVVGAALAALERMAQAARR